MPARRTYTRDSRGRFASAGGSGGKRTSKRTSPRLTARQQQAVDAAKRAGQTGRVGRATRQAVARLKASRSKLTANSSPQQRAAVTRANRLALAMLNRQRMPAAVRAGTIKPRQKVARQLPPRRATNGIRPGPRTSRAKPPANGIRPMPGASGNSAILRKISKLQQQRQREQRWLEMNSARALADRLRGGTDAEIASVFLRSFGGAAGQRLIQRRAQRAARMAAQGNQVARKALALYDQQLAAMPPDKRGRKSRREAAAAKAASSIVPGPRNPNRPSKPSRRRKRS